MKILLLNPPSRQGRRESLKVPPLGLAYIAASLRQEGYQVKIKDAFAEQTSWHDLEELFKLERPEILGLSTLTPVIDTAFAAIRIARPYVSKIIVGGPHVSIRKQDIFQECPQIDYGIVGEGENTIVELIRTLSAGRSPSTLTGVVSKDFAATPRPVIANLDILPFPARDLLPLNKYHYPFSKGKRITTIFTSRGCPFACVFCDKSVFGSHWRSRSAANVLLEVEELINRFKIDSIIIYDDLFTMDKKRVIEFCEGILSRNYKLDWKCESRVNLIDSEMLRLMKRAGCSMIAYGVESANQHALNYLNKEIKIQDIRKAFLLTHQAGIETMAYFILGIPIENYADEMKTIKFAKEINPTYAQFSILSPYYGTKLFHEAMKKGWYKEIDANNPIDQDLKRPVVMSPNWDFKKLNKILFWAYLSYYFRPRYIIRRMMHLNNLTEIINAAKGVTTLIRWVFSKLMSRAHQGKYIRENDF